MNKMKPVYEEVPNAGEWMSGLSVNVRKYAFLHINTVQNYAKTVLLTVQKYAFFLKNLKNAKILWRCFFRYWVLYTLQIFGGVTGAGPR